MQWPEPTTDEPAPETLTRWADEGGCRATDDCWLDKDADTCEHGHPSWAIVLGIALPLSGQ